MRYTTRELREAQARGDQVVPVMGSARGNDGSIIAARYSPRRKGDREPWAIGSIRYGARELTVAFTR